MAILHVHSTIITGEAAEQDVSGVKAAYSTIGLQPPAKPAGSWRLYHDVRMALAGFTKARLEGGGRDPKSHVPTTTEMIERLCYLTLKAIDREDLPMARAALANVWQYFNFSRPTMTASLDWGWLEFLSAVQVKYDNPPRCRGPQEYRPEEDSGFFPIDSAGCGPAVAEHPSYRIDWLLPAHCRSCLRKRCVGPKKVWQLPGDRDCGKEVYFRRHE
jgi:hypothetical protein